jgi:hypothetical protein
LIIFYPEIETHVQSELVSIVINSQKRKGKKKRKREAEDEQEKHRSLSMRDDERCC